LVAINFVRLILSAAAIGEVFAPLTAFAAGNADAGKKMYTDCEGCHTFGKNGVGPDHCGLMGRKAGDVASFKNYSEVMLTSGLTWDNKTFSEFMAAPMDYVPDTTMEYIGVPDQESRDDLIAYIKKMSSDPAVCHKK
jgi:cytochrome c